MDELNVLLQDVRFTDACWVLLIPFALMALDVLTGFVHAWTTGHLKSYRMREGLGRKAGEATVLIIGLLFTAGLNLPNYVMTGFSLYIILMELVSICENLKKMGVKIPKFIERALYGFEEKIQNDTKDGDDDEGHSG